MEIFRNALTGFLTGIILLALIVFIFRRQEDKRREKEKNEE